MNQISNNDTLSDETNTGNFAKQRVAAVATKRQIEAFNSLPINNNTKITRLLKQQPYHLR